MTKKYKEYIPSHIYEYNRYSFIKWIIISIQMKFNKKN